MRGQRKNQKTMKELVNDRKKVTQKFVFLLIM